MAQRLAFMTRRNASPIFHRDGLERRPVKLAGLAVQTVKEDVQQDEEVRQL